MRLPFLSAVMAPTFDKIHEHADKVKECAWIFQQAFECHLNVHCDSFEALRAQIVHLKNDAHVFKHQIQDHLPRKFLMPMDKAHLLKYIKKQNGVLESLVKVLAWISYRSSEFIPADLHKDFFLLVDAVMDPFEEISSLVTESRKYFEHFSETQRNKVKEVIHAIHLQKHEAVHIEEMIKQKTFDAITDPLSLFHVIRLAELISEIADHAEKTGDVMRAMLAR